MRIELDHDDFRAFAKKMASVIKTNGTREGIAELPIERYGIKFKVMAARNLDYECKDLSYEIEEVSYYGVNARNVSVSYDYYDMKRYGKFTVK